MKRSRPTRTNRLASGPGLALGLGLLALFLAGCQTSGSSAMRSRFPRAVQHERAERDYDVAHYFVDVALHPAEERIEAVCRVRLQPTRDDVERIRLDLVGLEVRSVSDDEDRPLVWRHDGEVLEVDLAESLYPGDSLELAIDYAGRPVTGLWFSGARADGSGGSIPNQVFTQGQPRHSRGWFPCADIPSDRATSEVRVTMPSGWVSVAPGERIDATAGEGTVVEHWRMTHAHPAYLLSLVAGEYLVEEDDWEGTPLLYVAEPHYRDWLEASFHETDEILSFVSEYTGLRYPYSKYSQAVVDNFPWGGMENISATTLTPLTLDDERGNRDAQSHGLVAHEAAHQWFGDLITCADWSHVWLNEGFATYMTELYFEASRGEDEFRARMRDAQDEYLEADRGADRRPTVWGVYKEPEDLFGRHVYQGAAARLHLLRFILGDDVFQAGVRAYVAENAGRSVVTDDLEEAMEGVSGHQLDWFFDQWFRSKGYPEFGVEWRWKPDERVVSLEVRQLQGSSDGTRAVFRTPVNVEIRDQGGTSLHRIQVTERRQTFELPSSSRPYYVRFDKNGWIPKLMRWNKSSSEWIAIATSDDDVNGRRDAVRALGVLAQEARLSNREAHDTYVAEIANRLRRDSSPWVREDAAEALGLAGGLEARERLVAAVGEDADARVRSAALEALCAWGENAELAEVGRAAFAAGYSWRTMGAAAGLVCSAAPADAYNWLTEKLFVDSPHDQLAGYLLEHLGALDNPAVNDQLARWARDESLDPTARAVAVKELGERIPRRPANAALITELLEAENFRLRQAAVEALAEDGDGRTRRVLEGYYGRTRTSRERRAIEAALVGPRP